MSVVSAQAPGYSAGNPYNGNGAPYRDSMNPTNGNVSPSNPYGPNQGAPLGGSSGNPPNYGAAPYYGGPSQNPHGGYPPSPNGAPPANRPPTPPNNEACNNDIKSLSMQAQTCQAQAGEEEEA
ncbi:hypothetical protein DFQ28_009378 [Apophysomyces sp. BC1034]|nr:hypothetical protein DFQ28_009378 [Apophysomyces sp. BC1034]